MALAYSVAFLPFNDPAKVMSEGSVASLCIISSAAAPCAEAAAAKLVSVGDDDKNVLSVNGKKLDLARRSGKSSSIVRPVGNVDGGGRSALSAPAVWRSICRIEMVERLGDGLVCSGSGP